MHKCVLHQHDRVLRVHDHVLHVHDHVLHKHDRVRHGHERVKSCKHRIGPWLKPQRTFKAREPAPHFPHRESTSRTHGQGTYAWLLRERQNARGPD